MLTGSTVLLIITVMAASAVEAVEALTIILASGITHGWRSTWEGTIVALFALAAVVGVLGTTIIHHVDIDVLRVIVGTLLLVFGLQWLTKAILRSSGFKALHDEAKIFEKEVAELKKEKHIIRGKRDSVAFSIAAGIGKTFVSILDSFLIEERAWRKQVRLVNRESIGLFK